MKFGSIFFTLIFWILIQPIESMGKQCYDCIEVEFHVEEPQILSHGVLVGFLEFRNTGNEQCTFSAKFSLRHSSYYFEIEYPNGVVKRLTKLDPLYCSTGPLQFSTLNPGESVFHPVCLMKDDSQFLFVEEGLHRVRACYHHLVPKIVYLEPQPENRPQKQKGYRLKSNWVDILVRPVGQGRLHFVDQNKCETALSAFSCGKPIESLKANLHKFHDYKREQQKLLVFNALGRKIPSRMNWKQRRDEQLIVEAKLVLSYAKEVGLGVEMWEWIVWRLESFPLDHLGRERFDVKNGFYLY